MNAHNSITLILTTAILASCCQNQPVSELRAPSYPLITIDPYTSAWSPCDELYGGSVEHWTGFPFPFVGVLSVDGEDYRFLGKEKLSEFRAIAAGAIIVNCVKDEAVPEMMQILKEKPEVELVIPFRDGVCPQVEGGLSPRLYLDPMIGFGTTREEDLELLRSVPRLAKVGRVLVGASRKRIVKKLTGEKMTGKNIGGNVAIAVWCAMHGASVVRVHDVKETVQALRVVEAVSE